MKKTGFFVLALVFVAAVAMLTGCAHYGAKGVVPQCCDDKDISTSIVRVEKGSVRVAAFPITQKKDARKYFGEDVISDGILAVYVDISNRGEYSVRFVSATLNLGAGETVASLTAEAMYGILKRGIWGKAILWMFPTYFVGAPISALHTLYVNTDIKEDLEKKALILGEVKSREVSRGFVWFRIPEKAMPNDGDGLPKRMVLSLIIEKEDRLIKYDLPIP